MKKEKKKRQQQQQRRQRAEQVLDIGHSVANPFTLDVLCSVFCSAWFGSVLSWHRAVACMLRVVPTYTHTRTAILFFHHRRTQLVGHYSFLQNESAAGSLIFARRANSAIFFRYFFIIFRCQRLNYFCH